MRRRYWIFLLIALILLLLYSAGDYISFAFHLLFITVNNNGSGNVIIYPPEPTTERTLSIISSSLGIIASVISIQKGSWKEDER